LAISNYPTLSKTIFARHTYLEDVMGHYAAFFAVVTQGATLLTAQDEADVAAYMRLLD
jgi:hypothetical protein